MGVRSTVGPLIPKSIKARLPDFVRGRYWEGRDGKRFRDDGDVRRDIVGKYEYDGDLVDFFVNNQGPIVDKWHHYLPIYERYFGPYRFKKPFRFLEIGVFKGGSIEMWRRYFGPDAIIFGIDVDENCRKFDGQAGRVRIGSQTDAAFLGDVVAEMGGVDVVLDDGSHDMMHIPTTLETLFPLMNDGGLYMIEDLHTAYWPSWNGGPSKRTNFFRYVSEMVDDMHRWYHPKSVTHPTTADSCPGIHIHDSIVVFEKNKVYEPARSAIGTE